MGKVRDVAKKVADKNKDGNVDIEDAREYAVAFESRWPLGAIIVAFAVGAVLGALIAR